MLLAIAIGGALGAPARYGIAQLIPVTPGTFPWATFWTNLSGAFVLGFFLTVVIERFPPTRFVRPFFGIGFLGAYTTFSTLAVETAKLGARRRCGTGRRVHGREHRARSRRRVPRDRARPARFRAAGSASPRSTRSWRADADRRHRPRGRGGCSHPLPRRPIRASAVPNADLPARHVRRQRERFRASSASSSGWGCTTPFPTRRRRCSDRGSAAPTPRSRPSPTRRWRSPRRATTRAAVSNVLLSAIVPALAAGAGLALAAL